MRVFNQWRGLKHGEWGIALLSVFCTNEFKGFVILGFDFEWPRTERGREIHRMLEG